MYIVALAGSPNPHSRSARLIEPVIEHLGEYGIATRLYRIHDFNPAAALHGRFDDPDIVALQESVAGAAGVVVATPVYKSAYSGALKTLLDLLPERALEGKPVLPLASGGSAAHLLAVDYALKPVLAALKAELILPGVYALDSQIGKNADAGFARELRERLDDAADAFRRRLPAPPPPFALLDSVRDARVGV